jgi:hypothetical protein
MALTTLPSATALACDNPIDFVKSYSHLGHLNNATFTDDDDTVQRRFTYFGEINNVLWYFRNLVSSTK